MNTRGLLDQISTGLGTLKNKIEIENSNNENSINVQIETVFLKILNILFDYNLVNTNLISRNFPAVDGLDKNKRVFVQITATFSNEKIEHTINQIIDKEMDQDFDQLYFLFLKNKKKISIPFKEKINALTTDKFTVDFDNCLIDINDIYRIIANQQDIGKALEVKKIIDEFLYNIPQSKLSGLDCIGVSFDDEDFDNAVVLIETIIKSGINVVVSSKKIYEYFKNEKSRYYDYLIMLLPDQKKDFISKYIFIVSNNYIRKNINAPDASCPLFLSCCEQGTTFQLVTFSPFLNRIDDKRFKNPKTLSIENTKKIEDLINAIFIEKPSSKYNFDDIKETLIKLYPVFSINILEEEKHYCFYNFKKEDINVDLNYLIFSHEYKRNEVIDDFNKKYKNSKYLNNLIILIPKDYNQVTELRIKYIKDKFPSNTVQYLDEYLYDNSLSTIQQIQQLSTDFFIDPLFEINESKERINDILDWLKNDSNCSVAFIIGAGGDGKTTVCQKIHDDIIQDFDKNIVFFLDAQSYITEIKNRERIDNWNFDLNTIFEICNEQAGKIDLTTIKSNFALGNITVIIDGIDEIISTLPNFNLKDFIEDFNTLKEQIGRGKLIINCRDIYMKELLSDDSDFEKNYRIFHLLKFDKSLAQQYFEKHFENQSGYNLKKVTECKKVLGEFYEDIGNEVFTYSPFVLEIIALIVENDFDYQKIEYLFDSKILLKESSNDYLIYKICQREIAKKESNGFVPPVDDYIKLLCLISIEKNGNFSDIDFITLLRRMNIDLKSEKVKNSLRDNPFFGLDKNSNYIFRFDFYNSLFKYNAIYIEIILDESFFISDAFINMLSNDFKYNSLIFNGLRNKLKTTNSDVYFYREKIKKVILEINNYKKEDKNQGNIFQKKMAISNLIVFLLAINKEKVTNAEIIKFLFSDDEEENKTNIITIKDFYFIDVLTTSQLLIDFTDMYFKNCHIENYHNFLNCTFAESTFFDHNCNISNVTYKGIDLNKTTLNKKNFDDKILSNDNSLFSIIALKEKGGESVTNYLKKYFRSFLKGNKLNYKITANSIHFERKMNLTIVGLNEILLNNNIVVSYNKDEIILNSDMKNKILKFLNQSIIFPELNKSIREINELMISVNA